MPVTNGGIKLAAVQPEKEGRQKGDSGVLQASFLRFFVNFKLGVKLRIRLGI